VRLDDATKWEGWLGVEVQRWIAPHQARGDAVDARGGKVLLLPKGVLQCDKPQARINVILAIHGLDHSFLAGACEAFDVAVLVVFERDGVLWSDVVVCEVSKDGGCPELVVQAEDLGGGS